jgi:NTE family protein
MTPRQMCTAFIENEGGDDDDLIHPDVDIALFEPDHRDPEMFGANTFCCSARRQLAEHAYPSTRKNLRTRRRALHAMFEPHGIAHA